MEIAAYAYDAVACKRTSFRINFPEHAFLNTWKRVNAFVQKHWKVILTSFFTFLTFSLAPQGFLLSGVLGLFPERKYPSSKSDYWGAAGGYCLALFFAESFLPPVSIGQTVAGFSGYYVGQVIRDEWQGKGE
jgi:hypothetical protein